MNLKNSVQLIGNLGKDPEVKVLESGRKLAKFSLATTDIFKNAKGEKVIETQWHNLVGWGKVAELIERVLKKGEEVCVQGKLVHKSYEDKNGATRYYSEVIVNELLLLSK